MNGLRNYTLNIAAITLLATTAACMSNDEASSLGGEYYGYDQAGENYKNFGENRFVDTADENTSTFSIDVDNGSYTLMRRDLNSGQLPAEDGVRVEEYVNYFGYDYAEPTDLPFAVQLEVAPSHFEDGKDLIRIGIKGKDIPISELKPTNLVFLVDVSGSMQSEEKLPLVQKSLNTLVDNLRETDRIAIVTYAGREAVVLDSTPVSERQLIRDAIDNLDAGGSTNGQAGIVKAYELAEEHKIEDGNNRVLLLTDGDFNVGLTNEALVEFAADYREKHISLTTVGYGRGNYNDYLMEQLANKANGNYFYIDSLAEAERIFGDALPSTLEVIAADVKIQVEFDAQTVVRYRLVGYENRVLDNEDFDDDSKDAGEIGPGHRVTALYEVELAEDASTTRLADLRIRYKDQYGDESKLIEQTLKTSSRTTFEDASVDFRFAAAVAEFAQILRKSQFSEDARFDEVIEIANGANHGESDRLEFIDLARKARDLR